MKYVLLCGGDTCNNYSLPTPLNYVNGKHAIEYIIDNIPSNDIYIIYNICLDEYNFQEIVINLFKTKKVDFYKINELMRGPVETAYSFINQLNYIDVTNEPLVFIDTYNICSGNICSGYYNFKNINDDNFIGYAKTYDTTRSYSFITINDNNTINNITNIKENKISDDYCCGIYGFKNVNTFQIYAKRLLEQNINADNDFNFSNVYKLMLNDTQIIVSLYIHSHDEINSINKEHKNFCKLRICFDLDNTLVTFPTIPNDYTSVKPIMKMINLLISLKQNGHEIIIYTARRMKTYQNNVGKVIKDIAFVTINTLEKFNIPYDELIFGKPIADIYIDDKALNPYINDISYFGL